MEEQSNNKGWLSETMQVALLPVLAYVYAYSYEMGFSQFYKIPAEYIYVDFMSMLHSAAVLAIPLYFVYFIVNSFTMLFHDVNHPIVITIKNHFFTYIYGIFLIAIFINIKELLIPSVVMMFIFIGLHFIYPLITQKGKKTYFEKLEAQETTEAGIRTIESFLGLKTSLFIFVLVIGCVITYQGGAATAMKKETYQFPLNMSDKIVLCKYGEQLICTSYNDSEKTINQEYTIVNLSNAQEITLVTKRTGRITVKLK